MLTQSKILLEYIREYPKLAPRIKDIDRRMRKHYSSHEILLAICELAGLGLIELTPKGYVRLL